MYQAEAELQFFEWVPEPEKQRIRDFFAELREKRESVPFQPGRQYAEYLRSPKWKRIRRRVLKRDSRLCKRCEGYATEVPHRDYEDDTMAANNDKQLASICEGCHNTIHFDAFGTKLSPAETERLLLEKCCDASIPVVKFDMRRNSVKEPQEWARMTAVQRAVLIAEHSRRRYSRSIRKSVKKARDAGEAL